MQKVEEFWRALSKKSAAFCLERGIIGMRLRRGNRGGTPLQKRAAALVLMAALMLPWITACTAQQTSAPDAHVQIPADAPTEPEQPAAKPAEPEPLALELPQPETSAHVAYVFGQDGYFFPNRTLTRAETAQMLAYVFGPQGGQTQFSDVTPDSWFAACVSDVAALLPGDADGTFRPNAPVTAQELAAAVCRGVGIRLPQADAEVVLPDAAVRYAALFGWTSRELDVAQRVTRAQAVQLINRALGRTPDREAIDALQGLVFLDVSPRHPAYYDVMEAALGHSCQMDGESEIWDGESVAFLPLAPGLHMAGGNAQYVLADGTVLTEPGLHTVGGLTYLVSDRNGQVYADHALHVVDGRVVFARADGTILKHGRYRDYYFDGEGNYSSGVESLDEQVAAVLASCTTDDMTQEQKLRACYEYVRGFKYLGRNAALPHTVKTIPHEKAAEYAGKIFETGKGDCYNFAASFCFLARALGYQATAIVGSCSYVWNNAAIAHGWVEIEQNGRTYLFDPQIENYNARMGISNETHGAYRVSYDAAPGRYYKN